MAKFAQGWGECFLRASRVMFLFLFLEFFVLILFSPQAEILKPPLLTDRQTGIYVYRDRRMDTCIDEQRCIQMDRYMNEQTERDINRQTET